MLNLQWNNEGWGFSLHANCTNDSFRRSAIATIGVECYGFVTILFPGTEPGCISQDEDSDEVVIGFANAMKLTQDVATILGFSVMFAC